MRVRSSTCTSITFTLLDLLSEEESMKQVVSLSISDSRVFNVVKIIYPCRCRTVAKNVILSDLFSSTPGFLIGLSDTSLLF